MTGATRLHDCLEDERVARVLENAVAFMRDPENIERMAEFDHAGFEAADVKAMGWEFKQLMQAGLIERIYNSNSTSYYRVPDIELAEEALAAVRTPIESEAATPDPIDPDELFGDVVGHDEPKRWIRRTIASGGQVHHLLVGEPGSGKSMMLDDVARLNGAIRVVLAGDQASAAGVRDVLLDHRPAYLVVEEIEKGSKADREALQTLCGNGYITRTKADAEPVAIELDTVVIAAGNDLEAITPASLVDRFMVWDGFEQYGREEFVDVCGAMLPREHDVDRLLAETIATELQDRLGSSSVRQAKRVAQLAADRTEAQELVEALT